VEIKTFKGGYDSNFTYVVHDAKTAVIIDPAVPAVEILAFIKKKKLTPLAVIILHSHFDHLVDLDHYRKEKIPLYGHTSIRLPVEKKVEDHEILNLGNFQFTVLHTPGHRFDCLCLLLEKNLFTSDTLFIGSCGRIDFPGSDPLQMVKTLERLRSLPDDLRIYPGHDYGTTPTALLGEQKKMNPYLKMSAEEFLK